MKRAKGLGIHSDTKLIKDINKAAWSKQLDTVKVNDAWREACKKDPELINTKSFLEFKKEYFRKNRSRKKFKNSKILKK
jgi:hypothetical protein